MSSVIAPDAQETKRIDADALKEYAASGYQIIPLHCWNDESKDRSGKPRKDGKRPLHSNWTARPYGSAKVAAICTKQNRNVGVRLRDSDLVVDIDPRNGGNEGFANLCADKGLNPSAWPRVETGSGGSHFYLTLPEGVRVVDTLAHEDDKPGLPPRYRGVEFKSRGRQVVAAGSVHPNGNPYFWDSIDHPSLADAPEAPAVLVDAIRRPEVSETVGGGQATQEQIARALDGLDVTDFREHDKWLKLMMACHHASNGDARSEFIEWSIQDPNYSNDAEIIGRRWDSLHRQIKDGISYRTLNKFLADAGEADRQIPGKASDDFSAVESSDDDDGVLPEVWTPNANNPYLAAQKFREQKRPTLMFYNGDWLAFNGSCYREIEAGSIKAELYQFLSSGFNPTKKNVSDGEDALKAVAHVPRDQFEPPCWLDGKGPFNARETLALKDKLLHLPSGETAGATPNFFTRNAVDYVYDPKAPKPTHWLKFLESVFKDAEANISLLQEIFGYLLLPDTRQQKIFLWDGPTRGGKGTSMRVLQRLIGPLNCASPTLRGIGNDPILESLIGKQVGIVSDMRLDSHTNLGAVAENLLRISGEDSVTFNRKYKSAWTGKLDVRFVILTNLPPNIPDVSGAITNRIIPIVSYQSFLGREDDSLESKLLPELPGILNWAIEGFNRLRERGRFQHSPEGKALLDRMLDLASPLPAFIRECCELDPAAITLKAEVYQAWVQWSGDKPGVPWKDDNYFARDLLAAARGKVRQCRPRNGIKRDQCWQGIRLALDFG